MRAALAERRVLAQPVGDLAVLGQPELLALVQVRAAGQREHEQRRGAAAAQAELLVRLRTAGAQAASRSDSPRGIPYRLGCRTTSWLDSTQVGRAATTLERRDRCAR